MHAHWTSSAAGRVSTKLNCLFNCLGAHRGLLIHGKLRTLETPESAVRALQIETLRNYLNIFLSSAAFEMAKTIHIFIRTLRNFKAEPEIFSSDPKKT